MSATDVPAAWSRSRAYVRMAAVLVALQVAWVWWRARERRSARAAGLTGEDRPPAAPAVRPADPHPTEESA